jgi:hypothetical protein
LLGGKERRAIPKILQQCSIAVLLINQVVEKKKMDDVDWGDIQRELGKKLEVNAMQLKV